MIKSVFILAGHGKSWYGAKDVGAVADDLTEREINVKIARQLTQKLRKHFPRKYVQSIGVETEASIAQKQKFLQSCITQNGLKPEECLAVHLHCNAHTNPDAQGVECYFERPALEDLARRMSKILASWFGTKNRGAKIAQGTRAGYIAGDNCPAILLEMGFLSNKSDQKYLLKPRNLGESIFFILKKFI